MPGRLFWAYARNLDALQAREIVDHINALAYAQGGMEKADGREYIRRIEDRATGEQESERPSMMRPKTMEEFGALMGGMQQVIVTPDKPAEGGDET